MRTDVLAFVVGGALAAPAPHVRGRTGAPTPATGCIDPDPCPVGGDERPSVLDRAMPT